MKIYDYITLAFRDLLRRKGRVTLTTIGIAMGVVLIVTMIGLSVGLKKFMISTLNTDNSIKSMYVENYEDSPKAVKIIDKNIKNIRIITTSIGVIVLIVASIGIVNTIEMAVYERVVSIGIMKSVGASDFNIKVIFLLESAFIGFLGGIVGVAIANGLNTIVEIALNQYISSNGFNIWINVNMPYYSLIAILISTTVISTLAGYYPARYAGNLEVVEALRGNI